MRTFVVQIDEMPDGWQYRITHERGVFPDGPFRNVGALISKLCRFLLDYDPEDYEVPDAGDTLGIHVSEEISAEDRFGG